MQHLVKLLFSPIVFAIGFLWPLLAQSLIATNTLPSDTQTWIIAALIVAPFAVSAQLRGSWIWIR